jgi:hypothetical protein
VVPDARRTVGTSVASKSHRDSLAAPPRAPVSGAAEADSMPGAYRSAGGLSTWAWRARPRAVAESDDESGVSVGAALFC